MPTAIRNLDPGELFARGLDSVKMSSAGGAHGWRPPTAEEVASLFPNYEVLSLLGHGGMGAVYKARQIALDRLVALKLLPLEVSVNEDFAQRFRREARALAKLNHPHIIAVHDFGQTSEGHLFFAMEFVEGSNLNDIIRQVGLNPEQALFVVEQVCAALAYAHGKGIVHRDIKPANVMIDTESRVKVADFGLARLSEPTPETGGSTMTGLVMGTPGYMAPEQMRGMNVDHRADIYSLGVMLYEMLCRETPQSAFTPPSQRIGCDPRIDQIVLKAMQQAPDHRYQSTIEMRADVETARTPPPPAPAPAPHASARHAAVSASAKAKPSPYIAIIVILAVLAAGAIFWAKAWWLGAGSSAITSAKSDPIGPVQTKPSLATPALPTPVPPVPAPIPRISVEDAVKRLMAQKGWEDIRISTIPDGTISVHLEDQNISDLSPLAGLPVSDLNTRGNPVTDLSPLRGLPLRTLSLDDTPVINVSPLRELPLRKLTLSNTGVTDLSPLRDLKLVTLVLDRNTQEIDLAALAGMTTLEDLVVPEHPQNLELLRNLPNLKFISSKWGGVAVKGSTNPAAEFWKTYDAEQAAAAAATMTTLRDAPKPLSAAGKWLAEQEPQWQAAFSKEVSAPFEKGADESRRQYLAIIKAKLSAAVSAGSRDNAAVFRAELDRLADVGDVPAVDEATTPSMVRFLRSTFRQRLMALEASRLIQAKAVLARYDTILAQNQALLTQRQRAAEALEIKTKRGQLATAWLTPPGSATANSGLVNGLIAWWKADAKAQDSVGKHHGSLVGGATFTDAKDGPAFSFKSATAGVSVPGSPAFDFGDKDFSIALWAKFSALASSQALVSSDDGAKPANQWIFWVNDGQLQWKMTGTVGSQLGSAKFAPDIGRWYRLAMIRAGAMFRFYIDGVEVSSQSWPGKIPGLGGLLTIGNAAGAFPFSGQLADTRIYGRALSAVEIEALPNPMSPPGSSVFSGGFWQPLSGKANAFSEPRRLEYLPNGWVRVSQQVVVSSPKRGKNTAMRARFKFLPGVLNQVHVRDDGAWNSYIAVVDDTGATASINIQTKGNSSRAVKTLATYPLGALISSGDEYKLELHGVGDEITIFVNDRRLGSVRDSTHPYAGMCSVYIGRGEFRDLAWRDLDSEVAPK